MRYLVRIAAAAFLTFGGTVPVFAQAGGLPGREAGAMLAARVEGPPVVETEGSAAAKAAELSLPAPSREVAGPMAPATLVPRVAPVTPQEAFVAGIVVDDRSGQAVAGAQVVVAGAEQGTITDSRGRFRIQGVRGTEVMLQVVMIGYRTLEQAVRVGDASVRLAITEAAIELNEIVVTGTAGAVQKRAIGNTVARIDATRTMEVAPVITVSDLVNARTPGVLVRPASGTAGAGSRLKIRGTGSLTLDTQPLIYVDGVRLDNAIATGPATQGGQITSRLNDINPDDIESIEIIKGPAAATLYGTEASSGVIQIITKKGRSEQLDIGVTMRQGGTWFMNPEDRFATTYYRGPETNNELRSVRIVEAENARGTPIFRTGWQQGYGVNLSGGAEKFRIYASGDFDRDEGVERPNVARRYSGRINLTALPHSSLEIATSLGLTIVRTDLVREESPTQSVTGATKRANPRQLALNPASRGFFAVPPEAIWEAFKLTQDIDRFTASLNVIHRPRSWLTHRLTLGGDFVGENNQVLTPYLRPEVARFFNPQAATGSKNVNRRDITNTTVDYSATATVPVSSALTSRTSVGWQYYRKFNQFFTASGSQFPAPGVKTVTSAAIRLGGDDFVENSTVGSYVQEEVSFNNRLFLTGAVRADDNSAFGRDFDIQIYPKVSASWVVSEEPFWSVGWVNTLRLRGAFGASGQQPDAFASIRTFEPVTGTGDRPAATPQSLGNSKLGPERGEEVEVGFEAGVLQDRVGIDFTYYRKTTKDAIVLAPVAPSTGFPGSRYINGGEIRNQGIELLLRARALETERADLDVTLNLSTNDAEILDMGGISRIGATGTAPGGPTAEHRKGYAPWSFFVKRVVSAQFDAQGRTINVMCDGGPENNGQPLACAQAPTVYVGKLEPDQQGALSGALTLFDRVRLYTLFDFQFGRQNFAEDNWVLCSVYRVCLENFEPTRFDPRRVAEVELGGSSLERSIYYNNAAFVKLRELSLNYTLPTELADRFGAKRASVTIAGRNLHTWTSWTQLDPESTKLGLPGGFDQATAPPMSQFVTTINFVF
ncbi:MAG: SusC/RagA family TonB-linked outer membrane protein [Gemmatimonadetes bacterium]|nr:SusC/RagA family TonB-linked outer membrane protein [Gemmatimonadota bacterium]